MCLCVDVALIRSYTRIGVVVMLLHDINDVLLETSKMFNYLRLDAAATAAFATFVASWAVLRVYAFPRYCIYTSFWESWSILGYRPPAHGMLNALLMLLYCIHLYWLTLILRVAWGKLTTGKARDIREDSDEDD
jgi:ceramide synthetase